MQKEKVEDTANMVTGTFSITTQLVDDLCDFGTTYSFIFAKLVTI